MKFPTPTTQPKTAKEEKLEARLAEAQKVLLAQDREIRQLKKSNLELQTKVAFGAGQGNQATEKKQFGTSNQG